MCDMLQSSVGSGKSILLKRCAVVLQWCCSVLQCVAVQCWRGKVCIAEALCSGVAVVLQCVAMCCSVLQSSVVAW